MKRCENLSSGAEMRCVWPFSHLGKCAYSVDTKEPIPFARVTIFEAAQARQAEILIRETTPCGNLVLAGHGESVICGENIPNTDRHALCVACQGLRAVLDVLIEGES